MLLSRWDRLKEGFARLNKGLLLAVAIGLLAAWPFWLRPSLSAAADVKLHVYRAAEFGRLVRAGAGYPRWAGDLYRGYGYPLFQYYAPLLYMLANLFSLFVPGAVLFGMKVTLTGALIAGSVGTFGFVRRFGGAAAGITAGAAYVFAPYLFLISPHILGHLAEFLALGLLPLALWALAAYADDSARGRLGWASLLVGMLLIAHNLQGIIGIGLLVGYALWRMFPPSPSGPSARPPLPHAARGEGNRSPSDTAPSQTEDLAGINPSHSAGYTEESTFPLAEGEGKIDRRSGGVRVFLPLLLGLGLSAFFYVPLIVERDAVQLGNLITQGAVFDYRNGFLSLGELFGPTLPLDVGALNPPVAFNLGIAAWVLALAGSLIGLTNPAWRRRMAYWLLAGAGLIALMLPISDPVWAAVGPLRYLQFPWRLLGPAALCLAIPAGLAVRALDPLPEKRRRLAQVVPLLTILVGTLPVLAPPRWGDFGPTDRLAVLQFELRGRQVGTTATGDFLPTAVREVPAPADSLIASYTSPGPLDKVDRGALPDGVTVEVVRHGPRVDAFAVAAEAPFTLRVLTFAFPGWRAVVDGEPVAIVPSDPQGLITVDVPAGEHAVTVRFGTTAARVVGWVVSGLALVSLILSRWWQPLPRRGGSRTAPTPAFASQIVDGADHRIVLLALAGFVLIALIGWPLDLFQPRSAGIIAQPAEVDLHRYLEGGVDLLGFDAPDDPVRPGESVTLTLYWKAREPVGGDYQPFVHATTLPEHPYAQSDALNPGGLPTSTWPPDKYVRDLHTLTIPPGTPPGEYALHVGLYEVTTGRRLLVLEPDSTIRGDSVALTVPLVVAPADAPPDPASLGIQRWTAAQLAPGVTLLGVSRTPRGDVQFGTGRVQITLVWRADAADRADYRVALRWVDASGAIIAEETGPPVDGRYPLPEWSAGEVVRDVHDAWLDAAVAAGPVTVEAGLVPPGDESPASWTVIDRFEHRLP